MSAPQASSPDFRPSTLDFRLSAPFPPRQALPMSGIGKLMKQATRMQQQMERVQQDLANKTVEGIAGGGVVKVVAKCDQTLASISIQPEAVNPQDVAFLEALVLSAVNDAMAKAKEVSNRELGSVTQGFSIPGLM